MIHKRQLDGLNQEELLALYGEVGKRIDNSTLASLEENKSRGIHPDELMDEVIELDKNPDKMYGIPTGIGPVDDLIKGLAPGDLIILAAETGRGKSMLAQNIFHNFGCRNIPTLLVSLEMSNRQALKRYVDMDKSVHDGENYERIRNMPLYLYEGRPTTEDIEQTIIELKKEKGLQAVTIDHLHYFARSEENSSGEIGHLVREFKLMARRNNIPIILISHLRKLKKPNSMPTMNDLRDSSFTSQDADVVIMMKRDILSDNPAERATLHFEVQKSRNIGQLGKGRLQITRDYKLKEMA